MTKPAFVSPTLRRIDFQLCSQVPAEIEPQGEASKRYKEITQVLNVAIAEINEFNTHRERHHAKEFHRLYREYTQQRDLAQQTYKKLCFHHDCVKQGSQVRGAIEMFLRMRTLKAFDKEDPIASPRKHYLDSVGERKSSSDTE